MKSIESLARVDILCVDKTGTITNNKMELVMNSSLGSMREEIEITQFGNDIQIAFNPRFLIEALKAIDDENITMYTINAKAPCFIKDKEESYIYLILPVNFNTI